MTADQKPALINHKFFLIFQKMITSQCFFTGSTVIFYVALLKPKKVVKCIQFYSSLHFNSAYHRFYRQLVVTVVVAFVAVVVGVVKLIAHMTEADHQIDTIMVFSPCCGAVALLPAHCWQPRTEFFNVISKSVCDNFVRPSCSSKFF